MTLCNLNFACLLNQAGLVRFLLLLLPSHLRLHLDEKLRVTQRQIKIQHKDRPDESAFLHGCGCIVVGSLGFFNPLVHNQHLSVNSAIMSIMRSGLSSKLTFHFGQAILRTKLTQEMMSKNRLQAKTEQSYKCTSCLLLTLTKSD